jgi:hypothetical protein
VRQQQRDSRDYASQYWYEPSAKDYACNQHPQPKRSLVKALAIHTHISESEVAHIIDRLRHLGYCLGEPSAITLRRLQAGKNQKPLVRDALGAQIEDA